MFELHNKWIASIFSLILLSFPVISSAGDEYVTFLHSDIQGSPIAATNELGNVVWREDYEPWGSRQIKDAASASGSAGNNVWYTGKEEEANLGLFYYGARWYDPSVGQFVSIDPSGVQIGNPRSFGRYVYANNNPIKIVDPDGRDARISVNGQSIKISTTIYIYGSAATQGVASVFQQGIMSDWNKSWSYMNAATGKAFDVSFDVAVKPYGGVSASDPFFIPEAWNPFNTDNFIRVDSSTTRSYVSGGDEGEWRAAGRGGSSLENDNPASHEFGHILGLADRYDDNNGANMGWKGNIMAEPAGVGVVQQKNINAILDNALKSYSGQQSYQTKIDEKNPSW